MKKILSVLLVITILLGITANLSGCQKNEPDEALTRAAWIDMLAAQYNLFDSYSREPFFGDVKTTNPYFTEIQACAEWEIIDKAAEFKPDETATNGFAIITAIKAIGTDRLERSDYRADLKTDDDVLTFFGAQSGLDISAETALTGPQADVIMEASQEISNGLSLPQIYEINFKDNVRLMNLNQVVFSADGKTATLKSGSVEIGDIIVIEPNEFLPEGKYAKIIENYDGQLSYVPAKVDEICNDYQISGTFTPKLLAVRPASADVTVVSIDGRPAIGNQSSDNYSGITCTPLGAQQDNRAKYSFLTSGGDASNAEFEVRGVGTVSANFSNATVDFSMNPFHPKFYLKIDTTLKASVNVAASMQRSIPLGSAYFGLGPALSIELALSLVYGFDGELSIEFTLKTTEEVDVDGWRAPKININKSAPVVTIVLDAEVYVKPDVCVSVTVLGGKAAYVGVNSGLEVNANGAATFSPDGAEWCLTLKAWVPLNIYYGYNILNLLKDENRIEIWNSRKSVWTEEFHIEDGKIVIKCTRNGNDSDEDFFPEGTDVGIPTEYLLISSTFVALNPNTVDAILITSMPDGYSTNDIVFSSSQPGIVDVNSSGSFTTTGEGTALIRVATSDGKHEQFCAVVSRASFSVEFSPLI